MFANQIINRVSAIILAAGLSRRMAGSDKLLLVHGGKTMLDRAIELMDSLLFYEKIVVTTKSRLEHIKCPKGVQSVVNANPEDGQSGSLRLGVAAASGDYYLFMPADQPLLDAEVLLKLLNAAENNFGKIIYPTVNGKPCNPTLFPASLRESLLYQTGDVGGRKIIAANPKNCYSVEIEDTKKLIDIDTLEDFKGFIKGW